MRTFNEKLCTLYTYGMSGYAYKLNVKNCVSWKGNCVHIMCGMSRFAEKLDSQNSENTMGNCVHYLYGIVYIICTECLDLQKIWISWTDGKLCTLYMCWMSGFAEKWNI